MLLPGEIMNSMKVRQMNHITSNSGSRKSLPKNLGKIYVLLVRLHPTEAGSEIDDFENIIYNVSNYDDIKDLYLITDILITDYSSVMFDFANTRKPIVFFAHDIERYSSALRGFDFDLKKGAPGPIVKTEAELFDVIENIANSICYIRNNMKTFIKNSVAGKWSCS